MTPRANRSLSPPFNEIGAVKFQELCADLMAEDPIYVNPVVYGRNGQCQKGIDIEAPLRDKTGAHVGQCKAWSECSASEIKKATAEFLPHLSFWQNHGLKKFILMIGCSADDQKSQDQLRDEIAQFKGLGVDYEWWDARILRRKLRPYSHIVRNHCDPAEYWVDFICGREMTTLDTCAQAGINAVLARHGTFVLELSDARNEQLNNVLVRWEEGDSTEAFNRIREFCQTSTWSELTPAVRAKSLRMEAALTLVVTGDKDRARQLLNQAKLLTPSSCMAIEASIIRSESGALAALEILKTPENLDAWNVRHALLLELGDLKTVLQELPRVPVQGTTHPNTAWIESMAMLGMKQVDEARRVLADALKNSPNSFKLRVAMATVQYASGISTVFSAWGHLTWPVPPAWHLVKRDEESRRNRSVAAESFAQLAGKVAGEERCQLLVWRLACLANEPNLQSVAAELCGQVLVEYSDYVPALVWAQEREYAFDKARTILALRSQLAAKNLKTDKIITLFGLIADVENLTEAERLLDAQRAVFEDGRNLTLWRVHKVQCLVLHGNTEMAQKLVDEESDGPGKRQVRLAMFNAIARKQGGHESLGAYYENEFRETGDGDALFSCCLLRRMSGKWEFIADHGAQLVILVGTDAALRVAAEGALNAQRPELVLKLLQDHSDLCPSRILPPDLERLRAEALKRVGQLGKAVIAAENAAKASPDVDTLMHLFRLKRSKGDLIGSAETAKHFLNIAEVPPHFLTQEVAPVIRHIAPELTRDLVLKAKKSIPHDSPALITVAEQASKLGLTQIAEEIFAKVPIWASKGGTGFEAVDVARMSEMVRQQAQSWAEANEHYRRGLIPIHALSAAFNQSLAKWFFEEPRLNITESDLFRGLPLLTRHAALVDNEPVQLDSNAELFLDITSILLLRTLNLLEVVESAFPKIAVPARLTTWLQTEADQLQLLQPDLIYAQEQALQLVDVGTIAKWVDNPNFPDPIEGWLAQMGSSWAQRFDRVKTKGGLFVVLMPLVANTPEMRPVALPENERLYMVSAHEIVAGLETSGRISINEADQARRMLGPAAKDGSAQSSPIKFDPDLEVHLGPCMAERLALAGVLKPLSGAARIHIHEQEVTQWREALNTSNSNAKLLVELEGLLSHISQRFDANHYRGHECRQIQYPPGHRGPLSEKHLCIQDTFDYALNGAGTWCADDRYLRGLRRDAPRLSADTFDIVHHLHQIGSISKEQLFDALNKLRAANCRYIPIKEAEILHYLHQAPLDSNAVVETAALGTIRRYMAATLLDAEWLQGPIQTPQGQRLLLESQMLMSWYLTAVRTITAIWSSGEGSLTLRAAKSDWVSNHLLFDMRLLSELFNRRFGQMSPGEAVGQSLGHLFGHGMMIPGGEPTGPRASYFRWLFDTHVVPIISNNPEILPTIGRFLRRPIDELLRKLDDAERYSGTNSYEFLGLVVYAGDFLLELPATILDALQLSSTELNRMGLSKSSGPVEVLGVSLDPVEVWSAIARAMDQGYGAILKAGIRLQFKQEESGRVRVKRKGRGTINEGYVHVPCMMLLSKHRTQRIAALLSCKSWLDLNEAERQSLFEQLLDFTNLEDRMRVLQENLDRSAAWFYLQIEARLRASMTRSDPIGITELWPKSVACLRRHLRLESMPVGDSEVPWREAIGTLLDHEGLEETVVRLSCLPTRLPEAVFDRLKRLDKTNVARLIERLDRRLQSPLQRFQFLLIELSFGDDLPRRIIHAKQNLEKLLDPVTGIQSANALLATLRWAHLNLGWHSEACSWSAEARLRVAWVHAGRLNSAFAHEQFDKERFTQWMYSNSQGISAASIKPVAELAWDAAAPSGVRAELLIISAVADFAAQLSAEIAAQLELPELFRKCYPSEMEVKFIWHDRSLRSNALGSYLGDLNQLGLCRLGGDELFEFLKSMPQMAYDRAFGDLQKNAHLPGIWHLVSLVTNGAPLPVPHSVTMDQIIQQLNLSDSLERDITETQELLLVAADFASRNRPQMVPEGVFRQILDLAIKASRKFCNDNIGPEAENDASRTATALSDATWTCSLVLGDVPATVTKFAINLSLLIADWPAVARVSESFVATLMQGLPLAQQQSLWRAALTIRARI
jgi:hypothetical protein